MGADHRNPQRAATISVRPGKRALTWLAKLRVHHPAKANAPSGSHSSVSNCRIMFAIQPKTRKIHFQSKVADVVGGAWKALMYYFAYLGLPSSSDGRVTVALLVAGVTQVSGSRDRTRIRLSRVQIRCRRVWRIVAGGVGPGRPPAPTSRCSWNADFQDRLRGIDESRLKTVKTPPSDGFF